MQLNLVCLPCYPVRDMIPRRYNKLKESSHSYIINQFGLSCFKHSSAPGSPLGSSWEASTFNFYIFPEPLKDSPQVQ